MSLRTAAATGGDLVEAVAPSGADLRLVPATVLAWAAVWWATGQTTGDVAPALALAVLAAAGAAALLGSDRDRWPAVAALLLVAAVLAAELASTTMRLHRREADPLTQWAQDGRTAILTGRVSVDPEPITARFPGAGQRWVLTMSLRSAQIHSRGQALSRAGSGSVVLLGGPGLGTVVAGQQIRVTGRLTAPDPGDAALAVATVRSAPIVLSPGSWVWRAANHLRAGLRTACAGLSPDAGGLLPALVVGDTSRLPAQLRDDLRSSGLTHLCAVSGANLVIVATAVSCLLALARASIRARVAGSALSILAFVVLARPEPSVLRAAVMAALGLIALLSARPGRGVPLLCATALILLFADPWLSRSFGFVLSVLATAGLLLLVPAWLRRAGGRRDAGGSPPKVWRQFLVAPIAVPLAALVSTAPVTVLLQPQLSVVSVPANLLAEPAVPVATLLGVLSAVLSAFWPDAAAMAAHAGGLATGWIAAVAHHGAAVPGGQIPWLPGVGGAALLTVLLLAVAVASLRPPAGPLHPPRRPVPAAQRWSAVWQSATSGRLSSARPSSARARSARASSQRPSSGSPDPPRRDVQHRFGVPALLCAPLVVVLVLLGHRAGVIGLPGLSRTGGTPDDWLVVQCDVGQGSATLLNTGDGRAIMVDTGPDPTLAARCLRREQVRALDLLVITHFHADHAGGISGVLPREGAPPILVSPLSRPADQARSVHTAAAGAGSSVIPGRAGMTGAVGAGAGVVSWQVVYPPPASAAQLEFSSRTTSPSGDDDGTVINDSSLALLIVTHGVRVLVLGDLETDAQEALLASAGPIAPVDVVVVAHHGSARQDPALYAELRPRVALIGVGADNDYGHPAPSALSMLNRLGARILRTDTGGQLTVAGTADRLRLSRSDAR